MWYELKVKIGQKLPKKTEMNKNEQKWTKNEQIFVLFQEDFDSLRYWWGKNKFERLGHNIWATLYVTKDWKDVTRGWKGVTRNSVRPFLDSVLIL